MPNRTPSFNAPAGQLHTQPRTATSWNHCWCCGRSLDHPSLCHCGQPHYCEGRPPNWCQRTADR